MATSGSSGSAAERRSAVPDSPEAIEFPLLLEAIHRRYGYDFRDYAPASMKRRVERAMREEKRRTISGYQERILRDPECMARFLDVVSVDVTAMFRDPTFYRAFRDQALPLLREQPHLRIWHAGCAGGEEVYSMAILLHEEGLLERTRLYATDMNSRAIERARQAIFPARHMQEYTASYQTAGGRAALSHYYPAAEEHVILREFLRERIVWSEHNLVCDGSFNELHAILCRNVMIYFNRTLQARVHELLWQSLAAGGALALGRGESLQFTPHESGYELLDRDEKLYRKLR